MPPRPADAAAFWNQRLAALADADATAGGLASPEAEPRLRQHGPNNVAEVHRPPAWRRFAGRFANPLIPVLLAASALSAVAGDLASFAIVVAIVLLSVLLDVVQEGRAQDAVATLQGKVALRAEVRRDGAVVTLPFTALVPGDAVLLTAGFAVFLEPPKASAGPALRALAAAGVAVKVLTGDGECVARHVCAELGLPEPDVVTGAALAGMDDAALLARVGRADLFCRVTPQQQLRVLLALKRAGRTVGYLGDGINDAPALHAADVGISVDGGADVAKAAAPVILMQPDLGVLHEGVVEGRRTVVNVDKYILMAGSANLGNNFSMVLAGLVLPFLPLLPIQVLLTNLVYDLAQMGLPLDRVDPERAAQPVHWDIRLIRRFMLVMAPVSTLFDMLTFGLLLLVFHAGEELFRTGWFVESLVTQILMIFAVRTRRHLFASRPGLGVAVLAAGAVAFTLALPVLPFGAWFGLVVPPAGYFAALLPVVAGFLVVTELAKRLFYARLPGERPGDKPMLTAAAVDGAGVLLGVVARIAARLG